MDTVAAGHVIEIITMKDLKFNWQLKIRRFKDVSALFPFYSLFYKKFVWGGGQFCPPGYNRVNIERKTSMEA